jgi:hypothetical protein
MANEFFPNIGAVAQQTDDLPEQEEIKQYGDQVTVDSEEERPLQEVESLCMNCGEQVHWFADSPYHSWYHMKGNYSYAPDIDTILQRGDSYVVFMLALRKQKQRNSTRWYH